MIIYHCTRDHALFLSYLLLCHPYIPFHFIEMIFILVPPVFLLKRVVHVWRNDLTTLCVCVSIISQLLQTDLGTCRG